jgi:elongation factor P
MLRRALAALSPARLAAPLGARLQSTTKITGFDIRVGDLLEIDKALWRVEKAEFTRKAQGAANVNVFLRHFINPQKKEIRLSSTETIQKAVLDGTAHVTVLYTEGANVLVMDATSFEQQELPQSMLGDAARFLQEGMKLKVESYKGQPVLVTMPDRAEFEVAETDEARERDAGGGRDLGAVLTNGVRVRLPRHVKKGDKVRAAAGARPLRAAWRVKPHPPPCALTHHAHAHAHAHARLQVIIYTATAEYAGKA